VVVGRLVVDESAEGLGRSGGVDTSGCASGCACIRSITITRTRTIEEVGKMASVASVRESFGSEEVFHVGGEKGFERVGGAFEFK
jgi:hypothetical protein